MLLQTHFVSTQIRRIQRKNFKENIFHPFKIDISEAALILYIPNMALSRSLMFLMVACLFISSFIEETNAKKGHRQLCRINEDKKCSDVIPRRKQQNGGEKIGKCAARNGECVIFKGRKRNRCFCETPDRLL
ncbi:hypothetical protein ACF0H5_005159 [Mactra antiquata]